MRTEDDIIEDIKKSKLYIWGFHFSISEEAFEEVCDLTIEYSTILSYKKSVSRNHAGIFLIVWDAIMANAVNLTLETCDPDFLIKAGVYKQILFERIFIPDENLP